MIGIDRNFDYSPAKKELSWVGLQDLTTEVTFNGSYVGEQDKISLINRLLDDS